MTDKSKVSVYLPPEVKEEAAAKAEKLGISLSGLMAVALNEYMKQDKAFEMMAIYKQAQKQTETDQDHNGDTVAERGGAPKGLGSIT